MLYFFSAVCAVLLAAELSAGQLYVSERLTRGEDDDEADEQGKNKHLQVVAEGGASGIRPDESVLAYTGAYESGASLIACDVQVTRDLVPVCAQSIDVASATNLLRDFPELAVGRNVSLLVDSVRGVSYRDLYPFPLFSRAEIAGLRIVRDSSDVRSHAFDSLFVVVELDIFLQLVAALKDETFAQTNATDQYDAGVYVELKMPAVYRDSFNISVEDVVMSHLRKGGWWPPRAGRRVLVQSYDSAALARLAELGGADDPATLAALVQMIEPATVPLLTRDIKLKDNETDEWFDGTPWDLVFNKLKKQVGGISVDKQLLSTNHSVADLFVRVAHDRRLFVHVYQFSALNESWNATFDSFNEEIWYYLWLKIDGIFTDDPADVRKEMLRPPHTADPPLAQWVIVEVIFIFSLIGAFGSCFAFLWVYWGTEKFVPQDDADA